MTAIDGNTPYEMEADASDDLRTWGNKKPGDFFTNNKPDDCPLTYTMADGQGNPLVLSGTGCIDCLTLANPTSSSVLGAWALENAFTDDNTPLHCAHTENGAAEWIEFDIVDGPKLVK